METKVTREWIQAQVCDINKRLGTKLVLRQSGSGLWIVSHAPEETPGIETRLSPELKLRELTCWCEGYLAGHDVA